MITQDVEKVVTILKLLQDARNINKKYNALPAIIANRNMFIEYGVAGSTTFVCIRCEDYKCQFALSYQEVYYESFNSMKTHSLIQRVINTLVHHSMEF